MQKPPPHLASAEGFHWQVSSLLRSLCLEPCPSSCRRTMLPRTGSVCGPERRSHVSLRECLGRADLCYASAGAAVASAEPKRASTSHAALQGCRCGARVDAYFKKLEDEKFQVEQLRRNSSLLAAARWSPSRSRHPGLSGCCRDRRFFLHCVSFTWLACRLGTWMMSG